MTSKNQVTLTFAGDSKNLERALDRIDSGVDDMAKNVDRASMDMRSSSSRMSDPLGS